MIENAVDTPPTRLLIVDDDVDLCAMLREFFQGPRYILDFESEGHRAVALAQTGPYDLLILDVMLPGLDGFGVLRKLRRTSRLPVLMLTAKAEPTDRIVGLDLGADDYLTKPFFPDELVARVRAILRRSSDASSRSLEVLSVGDLRLIPGDRDARLSGKWLGLTAMEYAILEQLMRAEGRAVSRDSLSMHIYDRLTNPFDRSVDTHVSRIRRKLGDARMILSVRGVGYQLRYPDASGDAE
jgi:two-component system response regulator CpxR